MAILPLLDLAQRLVLGILLVPVVFVLLDFGLGLADAVPGNPVVEFVGDVADMATPAALTTMFVDQTDLQTTLLVCAMYGLITLGIAGVFTLLRQAAIAAEERERNAPRRPRRSPEHQSRPGPQAGGPVADRGARPPRGPHARDASGESTQDLTGDDPSTGGRQR